MRPVDNRASPITISVGQEVNPSGPITNKRGDLQLQAGLAPKAIAIYVQMQKFQSAFETMKQVEARQALGPLTAATPHVIDRSLIYNPRAISHTQIGISNASAIINTKT